MGSTTYGWIYLHQGGRFDLTDGLFAFRRRDASSVLGRWMTLDPLSYRSWDFDLYRLLGSNPITKTDPTGLLPWFVIPCLAGAAIGVGGSILYDGLHGNLDACHTTAMALINAILGCASCTLLGSVTKTSLWLVDALRNLGFADLATFLWN